MKSVSDIIMSENYRWALLCISNPLIAAIISGRTNPAIILAADRSTLSAAGRRREPAGVALARPEDQAQMGEVILFLREQTHPPYHYPPVFSLYLTGGGAERGILSRGPVRRRDGLAAAIDDLARSGESHVKLA
jgi:hypothetical protein